MSQAESEGLDLTQFHEVFFDEAAEHLAEMESLLLNIDLSAPDGEEVNAIFRAAHSIKGGAATFGFRDITELTHEMETVFDKVRRNEMPLSTDLIDVFLASGDKLNALLNARRAGGTGAPSDETADLCRRLKAFLVAGVATAVPATATIASGAPVVAPGKQVLELVFGPIDAKLSVRDIDSAIGDLKDFGTCEELKAASDAERRYRIVTDVSAEDLRDALAFMVDPDKVRVEVVIDTPAASITDSNWQAAPTEAARPMDEGDFGLFPHDEMAAVDSAAAADAIVPAAPAVNTESNKPAVGKAQPGKQSAASGESSSIRVSIDKVDQLINLVGELVITQAMLAQSASKADPVLFEALHAGLAQLERNTRGLQEAAMSIRMMPMSSVFSRFPRVVRDLAAKLGKEVELKTVGEATELDKGLIERIVDPMTHLVRNSLDHGLELPADREAAGKPRKGTITLSASHQGGNIVIEVLDDGKGLARDKILAKARERGLATSDAMPDSEVWNLIFEAGFSTADVVTDVSGRGVGMDVVRRNILDMGGRVEIASITGKGTRMTIRLPLTLAILDGMSVRVGDSIFILPLGCIAESMQPNAESMHTVRGTGRVIQVRGEYLPIVALHEVFNMRSSAQRAEDGILVILDTEGRRTALLVDELVGQHQVVIKSLEANYRKVAGVSGATIMGDGRVALILDAGHLAALGQGPLALAA